MTHDLGTNVALLEIRVVSLEARLAEREQDLARLRREMDALLASLRWGATCDECGVAQPTLATAHKMSCSRGGRVVASGEVKPCG